MKKSPAIAITVLLLAACGGGEIESNPPTPTAATPVPKTTEPAPVDVNDRHTWQKPEEIFRVMGTLQGRTVAELFAADGYFTFKLLEKGANVIAIVNDPAAAEALNKRKAEMGLGDDRLKVRVVPAGDPGIGMAEADLALCVNHYANVPDRVGFFKRVRDGLKPPHQLFVIDFKAVDTPVGPPLETRMDVEAIMNELGEARYDDVAAHSGMLPYQFVMVGQDVLDMPMEQ